MILIVVDLSTFCCHGFKTLESSEFKRIGSHTECTTTVVVASYSLAVQRVMTTKKKTLLMHFP